MRVALSLIIGWMFVSTLQAAPLSGAEEPVYRGQPVGYWVARLKAKDWPTRLDGAHGLREAGPRAWAAVPALVAALDDEDDDVREMVVQALGSVGPGAGDALRGLGKAYEHTKKDARCTVLAAMLRIDRQSPETLKRLREAFTDGYFEIRNFALQTAIRVPDLEDKEVARAAAAGLADDAPKVRETAGKVLIHLGPAAYPAFADALSGKNKGARGEALGLLMSQPHLEPQEVDMVIQALPGAFAEREDDWRAAACGWLEKLGPAAKNAVPLLERVLEEKSPGVRTHAAHALIKIAPEKAAAAVATVLPVLKNEEAKQYHDVAIDVLGMAGAAAEPAVPWLIDRGRKGDARCVFALGMARPVSPAAVTMLFDVLAQSGGDRVDRNRAARSLQAMGLQNKKLVCDMRCHLSDDLDEDSRNLVARALVDIGCSDDDVAEILCQKDALSVADVIRLGRLAPTCRCARERLVDWVKEAQDANVLRRGRGNGGLLLQENDERTPAAIRQLAGLQSALPDELHELLNDGNPYVQTVAFYLVKKNQPAAVAKADRALLEGEEQPSRDGKTLAQWLEQAEHGVAEKRIHALRHLREFTYPRLVVPVLVDGLEDADANVRKTSSELLEDYPAPMDYLLAAAATDVNLRARLLAEPTIWSKCGRHFGPMYEYFQADSDPWMRLLAARASYQGVGGFSENALIAAMEQERAIRSDGVALIAALRFGRRYDQQLLSGSFQAPKQLLNEDCPEILFKMMRDPDPVQCCAAIEALRPTAWYSDRTLTALAGTAVMKSALVRRATAEALRRMDLIVYDGSAAHVLPASETSLERTPRYRRMRKLLTGLLQDPAAEVRLAAARSLGTLGQDAVTAGPLLRERLDDEDLLVRAAAAEALWFIDPEHAAASSLVALRRLLKEERNDVQIAALRTLAHMGTMAQPAAPEVVEMARRDRGRVFDDAAVEALIRLEPSVQERGRLAVEFLSDTGRRDLAAATRLVHDGMTAEQMEKVLPLLEALVLGNDSTVSQAAVEALHRLGPGARRAIPALLSRLRLDKFENRSCIDALREIVGEGESARDVATFLMQQSTDPKSPALTACVQLIGKLGPEAEILLPCMIRDTGNGCLSKSIYRDVFWQLAYSDATEKSVGVFNELLLSDSVDAYFAHSALARLGPKAAESVPTLKALLRQRGDDAWKTANACKTLLSIEDHPNDEVKAALLKLDARSLAGIKPGDPSCQLAKNLARIGPEFNQVLQTLVEGLRGNEDRNDREVSASHVFEFMAATAEASGDILPELFEVQRDVDQVYLFAESYASICDGKFDSAYDWDNGGCGTVPLQLWSQHHRSEAQPLRQYLLAQHKKAVPVLARYLKDYDPTVRLFAAYCVALLGPKAGELSRNLGSALGDRSGFPKHKRQADHFEAFYLVELLHAMAEVGPDKDATKAVGALLKHADARVQAMAAWLVSQPGFDREEALTALSLILDEADSMVRLQVVLARLRLEGKEVRAAQELDRFLGDKEASVRYQAARALCKLGRSARPSMETFRKWAKGDQHEQMCAAEAYWAIAGETQMAVSLLIRIANEHGSDDRMAELAERIGPEAEPLRKEMTPMRMRPNYYTTKDPEIVPLPKGS